MSDLDAALHAAERLILGDALNDPLTRLELEHVVQSDDATLMVLAVFARLLADLSAEVVHHRFPSIDRDAFAAAVRDVWRDLTTNETENPQ